MWNKQSNCDVDVYEMNINDKNCLIYNPQIAGNQNGNGWQTIARKNLIPYPYAEYYKIPGMTKTKYNETKSRLKLIHAEWETTDGQVYFVISDAIEHQNILDESNDEP